MIFVDSPTIPQWVITSQLLWSRDLPLDVIVTRRNLDHTVDSQHERKHDTSLLETVINPHIDHLHKLHFNVWFSSSLASFPDNFHGTATKLECRRLECREDDGGSTHSNDQYKTVPSAEPQFPALSTLELDGRNYYNGCRRGVPWTTEAPNVATLTISHDKPRAGESFPAYAFMLLIAPMRKLDFLRVDDVALRPIVPRPEPPLRLSVGTLELSDFPDFITVDDIFYVLDFAIQFKFTRCTTGSRGFPVMQWYQPESEA